MFLRLQWIKLAVIEMHLGGQIQKALLQEFLGRNFSSRPRRRCWWSSCVGHLDWKLPENGKVKQFGRTSSEPFFLSSCNTLSHYLWSQVSEFLENYIQNLKLDSTNILFQIQLQLYFPHISAHWSCKIAEIAKSWTVFIPQSLANILARFFQDNNWQLQWNIYIYLVWKGVLWSILVPVHEFFWDPSSLSSLLISCWLDPLSCRQNRFWCPDGCSIKSQNCWEHLQETSRNLQNIQRSARIQDLFSSHHPFFKR